MLSVQTMAHLVHPEKFIMHTSLAVPVLIELASPAFISPGINQNAPEEPD